MAAEGLDVAVHVVGIEGYEVYDCVELAGGQAVESGGIRRVSFDPDDRGGEVCVPRAPREHGDRVAFFHG